MLYISFLTFIAPKLSYGTDGYCGKWRKISKLCRDLDLGLAMPNTCPSYFHILKCK